MGLSFTGSVFVLGKKAICGLSKEVTFRGVSQKRDHNQNITRGTLFPLTPLSCINSLPVFIKNMKTNTYKFWLSHTCHIM